VPGLAAAPLEWPYGATGFLVEQGGGELAEAPLVGGEQLPCAGFGSVQQGADFLVGQPLDVLGVAARGGDDPEVSDADRAAKSRPVTIPAPPDEHAGHDAGDDAGLDQVLDRQLLTGALRQLSPAHQTVLVETF